MNKYIALIVIVTATCFTVKAQSDTRVAQERFDIPVSELSARDPFIFADPETQRYYLPVNGTDRVRMYSSRDLVWWQDMGTVFLPASDFWGKTDFWAPDLYLYNGKYYLFVTFSSAEGMRGTSVLVADRATGPYEPLVNAPLTPPAWMALDGSLYLDDDGTPWLLYCHEWLQVKDGKVVAQRLTRDLKETEGDPVVLFSASEAPWSGPYDDQENYVTDAPVIHRMPDGKLLMTWSSFGSDRKYNIGVCTSENGVLGPWKHDPTPLVDNDGGHAMLFLDFQGQPHISYHSPNGGAPAKVMISPVRYEDGKLKIRH